MEPSFLPRLEHMFQDSIQRLQPDATLVPEDVKASSELVYHSMSTFGRVYHDMQHVFDISRTMDDPILVLSALFHDVVYYSIDKAFIPEQQTILENIIFTEEGKLILTADFQGDELIEKVVKLYDFTPGVELPRVGTNEFVSCIIGMKVLSKWLSLYHLLEIAACIEATIPFRPVIDGKSPMDRLYDRLKAICPEQPDEWHVATMHKAAATANFDLCSFDSDDRDFFLDSSWKLIPEARPVLLQEDCPLIEWMDELKALEGRTKFLQGAVPRIFQRFGNIPSDEQMAEKQRKTHENLFVMWEYGKVRQLQAMVLGAIVEALGEDPASFSLRSCLTMDIPELSTEPKDSLTSTEKEVWKWLAKGRRTCFSWDPAISPLGAYLFHRLGSKGVEEAIAIGKNETPGSHDLLKFLPEEVVITVSSRLGAVFTDRAERFSQVPGKIGILA